MVKKEHGLAAQPALHVIRKVADAYRLDKKTKRVFRPTSAQPFDDRCLSWQIPDIGSEGTVSIWTVDGRLRNIRFAGGDEQTEFLRQHRQGETDLVYRDRKWFLIATCDVPDAAPFVPHGFVGVDLGIVNIAVTSTGVVFSGSGLNKVRHRNQRLRAKLQQKGTKSAKRLLKKRRRKEQRFANDVNHQISKQIVTEAKRTNHGIALEDLTGIRARVRLKKPQRVTLHSWSFYQLGQFVKYKAERDGVPVVFVDPAYTSQECSMCHHIEKKNRPNQSTFLCRRCGMSDLSADENAARNIASRGVESWAVINQPHAA